MKPEQTSAKTSNSSTIEVSVNNVILTPSACAQIVNEFFKGLVYQKEQIPYPFLRLKSMLDKKKSDNVEDSRENFNNFKVENYYRVVYSSCNILEKIMKGIEEHFVKTNAHVKEVLIIFGVTSLCPKEVFRICFPVTATGQCPNHHSLSTSESNKILRNIFLSQTWLDGWMSKNIPCTNVFIFLKAITYSSDGLNSDSIFVPSKSFIPPINARVTQININCVKLIENNCHNLTIFNDKDPQTVSVEDSDDDFVEQWYECSEFFKGFKDCFINKVSACELW